MASDFFLKLDGIDGESNDKAHGKWVELIDFAHGSVQNVQIGRNTEVAGRGQFLPFTFVHAVDKATPKLQQYCMNGQNIKSVEFHKVRVVAGVSTIVYEVKLENARVVKAQVKTISSGDTLQAVEEIELLAGKTTWKVTPIKPDGSKDGAVEANYDQVSNS